MTRPKSAIPLSTAELSSLQSAKGKKARAASPWNKGPNCSGNRAKLSYMRVRGARKEQNRD